MRYAIAILLAVIAVVAAGVWVLGEYGGGLSGGETEAQAPIVREPVAATPPAPQQTADLRSTAPASTPQTPPATAPEPATIPPPPPPLGATEPPTTPSPTIAPSLDDPRTRSAAPETVAPAIQPDQPVTTASVPPGPAASSAAAAAASSVADKFKARRVTYNRPPKTLVLNRALDVSLVINATDNPNAGAEALQGFPGTVVDRDVDLSDVVLAQLTGVGFDITSQTVERQKLSGKTLNRWQWRVTPTELGTRTLILEIVGYESGSLDGEPLAAYRDDIVVQVKQLDRVITWAKSVQPVFAMLAALAGALSALFAFLRFREEKKRGSSPPAGS